MKQWQILQADAAAVTNLGQSLQCSPIMATLLFNRGLLNEKDVRLFLNASLSQLRSPLQMAGMKAAVERVAQALRLDQKILIFGDYDVDGITATAILFEFLQQAGANVSYYIPHRIKEGYGLKPEHITAYAVPNRIDLIITVDCGIGSHLAVTVAKAAGIDIVITDHHEVPDQLPSALSVINPHRPDCGMGFENPAGVGVAFSLLIGLRKHLRETGHWQNRPEPNLKDFCDLVAVGTVADVVPMHGDNRILTAAGLQMLQAPHRPGLLALMAASQTKPETIDSQDIAFRLAPHLNAAGRLDHATEAVQLLTTRDPETARRIAERLSSLNQKRQGLEQKILADIDTRLKRHPEWLQNRSLVLEHSGWHEGVLGIVASRLQQTLFRPVVLLAIKGGFAIGSARSIPGFDLYKGLGACSSFLKSFGGHPQAAGLSLAAEMIEPFRSHFEKTVVAATQPGDFLPTLQIDCKLDFSKITPQLLDEIALLEPHGCGNPEPLFAASDIEVVSTAIVGKSHRRMQLKQPHADSDKVLNAIQFNVDPDAAAPRYFRQMAFQARWNYWNGKKTPQLIVAETIVA